jgi:hypothetical protein
MLKVMLKVKVMQASTQEDEDTSHSQQHLKSDTVTQPATTETEIVQPALTQLATTESEVVQPALTQPSHIIEGEELNMAAPDTNAALPEKVMPETPKPPASSDISAMLQRLLSGQDSQADHNRGVKTAQDRQEGRSPRSGRQRPFLL